MSYNPTKKDDWKCACGAVWEDTNERTFHDEDGEPIGLNECQECLRVYECDGVEYTLEVK